MNEAREKIDQGLAFKGSSSQQEEKAERRQYTLKGVEQEAVDLMRQAADAQGMKIGHWVSDRIKEAAKKALVENRKQQELLKGVLGDECEQSSLRTLTFSEGSMAQSEIEERLRRVELEIQDLMKQQRDIFALLAHKAL